MLKISIMNIDYKICLNFMLFQQFGLSHFTMHLHGLGHLR